MATRGVTASGEGGAVTGGGLGLDFGCASAAVALAALIVGLTVAAEADASLSRCGKPDT